MDTVNYWAGAIGGTILTIELILLLIVLVALNAGLAYGLWWLSKRMGLVHEKRVWVQVLVYKWTNRATGIAAAPVIRTTSFWRGFKAGLYRATHWSKAAPALPARSDTPAAGDQPPRVA